MSTTRVPDPSHGPGPRMRFWPASRALLSGRERLCSPHDLYHESMGQETSLQEPCHQQYQSPSAEGATRRGRLTATSIREVVFLDFEFIAEPGARPKPICMVAAEQKSGRMFRLWLVKERP